MENIKIGLQIDSNTKNETADAKKLHDQLKQAADAAGKIKVSGGAAKAAAQPGSKAASSAQPVGSQAVMEYGSLRGTAGATGASARDFANQAQGLSGLVRLYAIYAANVYAVGAGFQALSRAMDTTNMVRGLDQIGAASGVALGGLSKQLVTATGGAISLREAMSATVKVTAAGLGSENVLRLGQVAAKASQALGVDMGDAINRLSRGITKLEPELLDELGIFTKIDPAVQKYALSVGKTAGQLTDFERRQAFANAVLEEGEKKFAAIRVDANPYNKLAASLQNIAQSGLELINNVLGPIVNLLSSSPGALVLALAGIGSTIIKQAVPAFGLFRQNIQRATQEANQAAQSRANFAVSAQQDLNKKLLNLVEARAEKEAETLANADKKFQELKARGATVSKPVQKVLAADVGVLDITDKQIASVEKAALDARKKGLKEQAAVYDEIATAIKNGRKAEEEYLKTKLNVTESLTKDVQSRRTIIGLNAALAESAEKANFKQQITSNTAYAGSLIGPINAIKLMRTELDAADIKLSKLDKTLIIGRASIAAFAGAAATLGAVLMNAFAIIGAIVGIGTLLATLFTNTRKEAEANSQAFGQLEESTKGLANSIDVLNKKPYLEQFAVESINAKANALEGFSAALQKSNQAAQAELSAMNWLDKSVDLVKMLWSGDVQSRLNKETAYGLAQAFSSAQISGSEAGKAARQSIASILKIDPSQVGDLNKVEEALSRLSRSEAAAVIAGINAEVETLGKSNRVSATALNGLEEGFKKIAEIRKKFTQELIPQDSFSQFGSALVSVSFEIEAALKNPETQLQAIKRTFEELKNVGGISPDLLIGLQDVTKKAEELQVLTSSLAETDLQTEKLTNKQKELEGQLNKLREDNKKEIRIFQKDPSALIKDIEQVNEELKTLGRYKDTNLNVKLNLQQSIDASQKLINEAQIRVFETGSQIVSSKLSAEFAKAGQTITNAFAGLLSGTDAGLKLRAEAEKVMLSVQLQQIKAQEAQIRATAENTVALKERSILDKRQLLKTAEVDDAKILGNEIRDLQSQIDATKRALEPGGTYDKLTRQRAEDLKQTGTSGVTSETLSLSASLEGSRAAQANIAAQFKATDLKLGVDLLSNEQKRTQEEKTRNLDKLKAARDLALLNKDVFNQTNETALVQRQSLDTQIRQSEEALRQLDAENRIETLKKIRAETNKQLPSRTKAEQEAKAQRLKDIDVEIGRVTTAKEESRKTSLLKEEAEQQKDILERVQLRGQVELEQFDRDQRATERRLAARTQELTVQQQSFDILSRTIQLSPEYIAAEEEVLSRKRAQLEFDKQSQQLKQAQSRALLEASQKEQAILATATGEDGLTQSEIAALQEIQKRRQEINTTYSAGIELQNKILTTAQYEATAKKGIADEQNRYNRLLTETQSIGTSLQAIFAGFGDTFEKFGQGLSNFATTFAEVGIQAEKNAKAVSVLQQAVDNPEATAEERAKAEGELTKAKQKQTKDELAGNIKLVASAKSMFKEKTAAYKVLNAVEKAMHITKLAMQAKETIVTLLGLKTTTAAKVGAESADTAATFAGTMARLPAKLGEILANAYAQLGPIAGPAVGAALVAAVIAMIGKGGGGKSGAPAITAEQRQETQGTAMGFNAAGEKTQVRRGVFGDTEAKSESISNSLEAIKDSSVLGLSNDNKVVKALEKINRTLETSAQELYRIEGLRTGSAIGTVEGTKTSGIIGLFGKTTTNEIIDSGLKLQGTFLELAKASGGVVQGFETVKTTTKKSGFLGIGGSTRTNVTTNTFGLDPKALEAIQDALGGGFEVISALGEQAGLTQSIIESQLANVRVDELVSLRGLKGEELQKELSSVVSAILDDASLTVFQSFEQFAKFGEGMLETVSRVTDTNRKVEAALQNLTGNAQDLSFELTETIAQNFGGVKQFTESIQEFTDRFLTDAERLQIQRTGLQRELDRLGYGYVRTKDDFKQAIQGLINSGQAGSELFASMMKLQGSMLAVSEATKQTNTNLQSAYDSRVKELQGARDEFKKFAESLRDYRQSLLTGSQSPLTPMQQYLETQLEYERIKGLAQAGDKDAIQKLQGAASAFLQSSQRMYASSAEYVQDFDRVTQDITSVSNYADSQASLADQTLLALQNQFSTLVDISVNTERAAVELTGLGPKLAEALNAYNLSGAAMGMAFDTGGVRKYALGGIVAQMTPFQHSAGLGVMGEAGPEAIMPLTRMSGGELGVRMAGDVNQQLAKLNQQIAELTQVVANGAVMNAQATDRNTEAVVEAVGSTAETTQYQTRLQNRTKIV
jgi:hypothetical protein